EALGVDLLSGADGLAGRLLKAANNLRLADEENERLRSHLVQMSEAVVPFIGESVAGGEDTVKTLRAAASRAGRALERGIGSSGLPFNEESSRQTKIVGLKPDLGLVVVDSGGEMGLREGAPLRIYRGEDVIATALVVEVRPRVSGAILTGDNANSDAVAIGDTARLNLVNSFKN
ncbi:MAG: hypothetical protein P8J87_12975, partial [Verrucomicrobiales bacterium]|nr:hypothetical protein [Verrucomicrobiales bacterium]